MKKIQEILCKHYDIGPVEKITLLQGGIINLTWQIDTADKKFVFQKLNDIAFDENVIDDQWSILEYLHEQGFDFVPKMIKTYNNQKYATADNSIWRLIDYIDHDWPVKKNDKKTISAINCLAYFHNALHNCNYVPKHRIADFHDSPRIYDKLMILAGDSMLNFVTKSNLDEIVFIGENMPKYFLPSDLVKNLIHGDPKFDNFLFVGDQAIGLIDFDTVMISNELVDIGDFCRSACREDNFFNKNLFDQIVDQYLKTNNKDYVLEYALKSTALITIELACRFLIDCYSPRGKEYFGWNPDIYNNPREHNEARAKSYLDYFRDIIRYI